MNKFVLQKLCNKYSSKENLKINASIMYKHELNYLIETVDNFKKLRMF